MSATSGDRRPGPVSDLRRFAPHTVTTKPWQLEKAIDEYARAGFGGMSIWRDAMDGRNPATVRKQLTQAGLTGVSLVRGGFFAQTDPTARAAAMEDNRRCIAEAHELGLPLIVLVCGADPTIPLEESRAIITDSLAQLAPEAAAAGVQLGIEPLHPMYADTRSAVNTLTQAVRMAKEANAAAALPAAATHATPRATPPSRPSAPSPALPAAASPPPQVTTVVDVYHLWWDETLPAAIAEAGAHNLLSAFHVCDWRVPTEHMLLDRGLMGEGCIDIPGIRGHVEAAGFTGLIEVEIFSERYWTMDQSEWLQMIIKACRQAV